MRERHETPRLTLGNSDSISKMSDGCFKKKKKRSRTPTQVISTLLTPSTHCINSSSLSYMNRPFPTKDILALSQVLVIILLMAEFHLANSVSGFFFFFGIVHVGSLRIVKIISNTC